MRLPVRRPIAGHRSRRRAARRPRSFGWRALLSSARLVGLLLTFAGAASFAWLTGAEEFELEPRKVSVAGVRYTDLALVQSTIRPWLEPRPNTFRLAASELEQALAELPAVAHGQARIVLPDRLEISLVERVPVFVWRSGATVHLVDSEGVLLREVAETETLGAALPHVEDRRTGGEPAQAGWSLAEVEREAVLKLAALRPSALDSRAMRLRLTVEDEDGFVLHAEPGLWRAAFGHYTPSLRPPEIIERQVQCLRSLLAEQEETLLEAVYLSPADDRCGTFVAEATPEPDEDEEEGE